MKDIGSIRHWTIALLVATAAHASLLAFLMEPAPTGARSAGVGGIELSLGPAGGAPGTATPVEAAEAGGAETRVVAREVEPDPATAHAVPTATAVPPPTVTPTEVAPVAPVTAPAERPVEAARVDPVTPPTVRAVEPPKPPRPKPPEPVRAEPRVPAAITPPMVEAPPVETRTAPAATAARLGPVDPNPGAAPSGAAGRAGARTIPAAGSGASTSGGGVPGTTTDYLALLQAWLERHKEYPQRARFRRIEGTAVLYFMMDRNGRVLDFDIRRSSGSSIVDEAVTAMIKRAEPLPALPDDMPDARLELVVPIQFQIR